MKRIQVSKIFTTSKRSQPSPHIYTRRRHWPVLPSQGQVHKVRDKTTHKTFTKVTEVSVVKQRRTVSVLPSVCTVYVCSGNQRWETLEQGQYARGSLTQSMTMIKAECVGNCRKWLVSVHMQHKY